MLTPTILMTFALTRDPIRTLRLNLPTPASELRTISRSGSADDRSRGAIWPLLGAAALGFVLQPLTIALQPILMKLYPVSPELKELDKLFSVLKTAPAWFPYLLMALLPAVCEELAFRGFILSGLRNSGSKWRAIFVSSLFFAITHQILQQSILAFGFGVLLGYLAVQTGSLWPGVIFHAIHNGLGWWCSVHEGFIEDLISQRPTLSWFLVLGGTMTAGLLLAWFSRLSYVRTDEEQIREAIDHETGAIRV